MARIDVAVLGAGIVGTSVALHLVKRGGSVALIDRKPPGEETSFGNAGVIEGNTIFPPTLPRDLPSLLRIAFNRAPEANYQLSFLPRALPWLRAFAAASNPRRLVENARLIRPLFAQAVPEHEKLMLESGATRYLRKTGWLKVYRRDMSFRALAPERDLAAQFGMPLDVLDVAQARVLEPSLAPVFSHGVFWPQAASISSPIGLTRAYVARFEALGGVLLHGDALSLHRSGGQWRLNTAEGVLDADQVVVALGPWTPDLLEPLGIKLPMGVKRGYHRHFHPRGNAGLSRPVLDADGGYLITPMEQGLRITTGAEIAPRDAPATPVQFDRLMPKARELFPLGERADDKTWMGVRPCFPDSRPVIDRAPGQSGMWLAFGHAHWGLTLGPATGRLIGEMMAGETPFCDPAPYRAARFTA
jgi:D-amino-acid dehydrogenase